MREFGVTVEYPGIATVTFACHDETAAGAIVTSINRDSTPATAHLVVREVGEWQKP